MGDTCGKVHGNSDPWVFVQDSFSVRKCFVPVCFLEKQINFSRKCYQPESDDWFKKLGHHFKIVLICTF